MNIQNNNADNACEQTELLIDDYLEGMISLKDKEIMDAHIAKCGSCSKYISETSALIKDLNTIPGKDLNLSVSRKNNLWNKVEGGIDVDKYKKEKEDMTRKANESAKENKKENSFFEKYKYILSGVAAVLVITLIIYGVKNLDYKDARLVQQNTFGLQTYWKVSNLQGTPLIGDVSMSSVDSIKEGQIIKTNDSSRAELVVANMGKVIIEPNSKIIFVKGADGNNRILIEYGTINANMNSQPETFFVEMPSAVASDMGGAYSLTIDSTGDGLLFVKSGKVEIQSPNTGAIIPAGNLVMTKKDVGVGTPFNENSSAKFKNALFNLDFGNCGGSCVTTLLNSARMSDAISLVNLIPKVENQYKDDFYTKLANFVPPPKEIKSDSLPFLDREKLQDWIDKIQIEVQANVERSLKEVEKNLEEMKHVESMGPDSLKALEDFARNWKYEIHSNPKGDYEWKSDSTFFDKEQFKKDMKNLQKELKENALENKEQLKENMDQLKENLQDMKENLKENLNLDNEELKREMQKAKEEIKKSMEEIKKNKIEIENNKDYVPRYKVKVKTKDDFEPNETPESPKEPEKEEK